MMKTKAISISKFEANITNEDSALCRDNMIAVSDGAGGGGVYAEFWSKYLVENLPDEAIADFETLDNWIDGIWEQFYNEFEIKAKAIGGMFLNKFYDEGSFATLASAWKTLDDEVKWITYGDSVVFHYNKATGELEYSIPSLTEFNQAPYLINYIAPIKEEGFKSGRFAIDDNSVVFVTTDALAHYIIMMYMISRKEIFNDALDEALKCGTKNSNYIKMAMSKSKVDFCEDVIRRLSLNAHNFRLHLEKLYKNGLIALDDYSVAIMY